MIVIAVIGVLMAIAAPNIGLSMKRGKERSLKNDLEMVRGGIAAFYTDTGCFPLALADLTSATPPANCVQLNATNRALAASTYQGPYLPFVPQDSVSGASLTYRVTSGIVGTVRSSATGSDLSGVAFSTY